MIDVFGDKTTSYSDLKAPQLAYLRAQAKGNFSPTTGMKYGFLSGNEFNTLDSVLSDQANKIKLNTFGEGTVDHAQAKEIYGLDIDKDEMITEGWARYQRDRKNLDDFYSSVVGNVDQDRMGSSVLPFLGGLTGSMIDGSALALSTTLAGVPIIAKAGQALTQAFRISSPLGVKLLQGAVADLVEETITETALSINRKEILDRDTTPMEFAQGVGGALLLGGTFRTVGHLFGSIKNAKAKPFDQASEEFAHNAYTFREGKWPDDGFSHYYTDRIQALGWDGPPRQPRQLSEGTGFRLEDGTPPPTQFFSVHNSIDGSISRANQVNPYNILGRGFTLIGQPHVANHIAKGFKRNYSVASISLSNANLVDASKPLGKQVETKLRNYIEERIGGMFKGWILGDVHLTSLMPTSKTNVSISDILENIVELDKKNPDLKLFDMVHDFFVDQNYDGYYFGNVKSKNIMPQSVHIINDSIIQNIEANTRKLPTTNRELPNNQKKLEYVDSIEMGLDLSAYDIQPDNTRLLDFRKKKIKELNEYYNSVKSHPMYNENTFKSISESYNKQKGLLFNEEPTLEDVSLRIQNLQEEVSYMKQNLQEVGEFRDTVKTEMKEIDTKVSSSEARIGEIKSELRKLRTLRNANTKIKREDTVIPKKIEKLESEMVELQEGIKETKGRRESLETLDKAIRSEMSPKETILRSLNDDLDELMEPTRSPDSIYEVSKAFIFCRRGL